MATPATDPIKQRYTAGSCALEMIAWPSALSQWSEHVVAERLTFRLWLADGSSTTSDQIRATKMLVAEGDRTALQAVTQYIQSKTRQTLAVRTFSTPPSGRLPSGASLSGASLSGDSLSGIQPNASSETAADASCPPEFQYPRPLGYLQLCDLNTVLGQCERAVLALPLAPDQQLSEDVILLDAVRDRRSIQSSNILQLPRRPRKQVGLWASSAAAALFAVGLTTTLLSRDPALQESTIANNRAASSQVSELEAAQKPGDAVGNGPTGDSALDNSTLSSNGTQPTEAQPGLPSPAPSPGASSGQANQPLPKIPNRPPTRNPVVQPSGPASAPPLSAQKLPDAPASTAPTAPAPTRSRSSTSAIAPPPAIPESSEDSLFADQLEAAPEAAAGENNAAISSARSAPASQSDAPQPAESARGSGQTVNQVQSYFQQRWQGGSQTVLVYELRLSTNGEVIGFTAINEAAERERENVFPTTARPAFSVSPGAGNLTLRVLLNGNGTVQVIQTSQSSTN